MKRLLILIVAAALALSLCACGEREAEVEDGRLRIVTTVFPAYDFARQVAGDQAKVTLLVPPGAETHSFEPTAQDMRRIQSCDLLIGNGGESEAWLDTLLAGQETEIPSLVMLECVDALEEELKEGMQGTGEEDEEDEIEYDEHVWTSPVNAQRICRAIAEALAARDEEHREVYQANCEAYCEKLMELDAAFRPNTKAVFGEPIANPALTVLDIEKFARIAHKHGVPLIVDNTFPTPVNCRPFEWGADIVTHSTTKYMDGHATQVGGCIVDSGNFDWDAHAEKFPGLCTPDESYHGLTYTKKFGKMAYMTKLTAQLMRDLGSIPSPHNAFLLNIGLETLHLRMQRHCENAQRIAEFLQADSRVAWVHYSGLPGDESHQLAQKYLPNGSCGVIAFGLKGTRETAIRFMDSLQLICIVTHVADARTCVLHPASHTHRQLSDEQLLEAGVAPDLIRLSVGIENVDDLLADIRQALDKL